MNRRRADAVVGLLVGVVLLLGGGLTWEAYQQRSAMDGMMGSMMDSTFGAVHGTNPLWYGLGTLVLAAVVVGLYAVVREDVHTSETEAQPPAAEEETASRSTGAQATGRSDPASGITPEEQPLARVLDLLPEDERRVLEPVLDSPGITQIELRDRSDFSKSKVSQTVSDLEKRGLLYRERQGRTYRIYPSDELQAERA